MGSNKEIENIAISFTNTSEEAQNAWGKEWSETGTTSDELTRALKEKVHSAGVDVNAEVKKKRLTEAIILRLPLPNVEHPAEDARLRWA